MGLEYNPDALCELQPDDWSCSVESTQWLLRAMGRNPYDSWIRPAMLNQGVVTREDGLMDASGRGLVAFLQREYGPLDDDRDLVFVALNPVYWDDLANLAGVRPVLIGGRAWNHWSGVRRPVPGGFELANPAPNWLSVGNVLDRAEFERLGGWSAVTVYARAELEGPDSDTGLGKGAALAEVRELLQKAVSILDTLV